MRPVGDIFIDNGVEIEAHPSSGYGCRECYYHNGRTLCARDNSLTGTCVNNPYPGVMSFIIFKKHIRKTIKLDLTE